MQRAGGGNSLEPLMDLLCSPFPRNGARLRELGVFSLENRRPLGDLRVSSTA